MKDCDFSLRQIQYAVAVAYLRNFRRAARRCGTSVSGGTVGFSLNPGATATLRITSGDASAGTLSGFAGITTPNQETAGLLEGNLTYDVKSPDGTIVDSVGVAPSRPFIQAVIPFDDFETVALALANRSNQTTTVQLTVFDDKGTRVGTTREMLATNQDVPRFLYQFIPGVSLRGGRVEIISQGVTILGTALTFVKGGQASSLPFQSQIRLYDVTLDIGSEDYTAQVYIAIDFPSYVSLYVVDTVNGVPEPGLDALAGVLEDGKLLFADFTLQLRNPLSRL